MQSDPVDNRSVPICCDDGGAATSSVFDDYKNPLSARGLLLIDEIDLHLHPVWQRSLRQFLEAKLPNFQIVATTHSPLTAQQAGEGELYFLRRSSAEASPSLEAFLGTPRKLMLHQLLLSPQFGLETVDSHAVEEMKNEYRSLKRRATSRSPDDERRLTELAHQLESLPDWFAGVNSARSMTLPGAAVRVKRRPIPSSRRPKQ